MKSKLFILMAALVSVVALSSCLGESESYEYPKYEAVVTVGADAKKLYSDGGQVLKPVNTITGSKRKGLLFLALSAKATPDGLPYFARWIEFLRYFTSTKIIY